MQTSVQNESAVRMWSGKLLINDSNVGLLDNATLNVVWNVAEITASNWKLPPRKKPEEITFSADLYEIDLSVLQEIDKHGVLSSTTGTETSTSDEISSWFDTDKTYVLENQNGDGTQPTITEVSGTTDGVLAEWDDYYIVEDNNGDFAIVFEDTTEATSLSTTDQVITVSYDYTPNVSEKITFSDVVKLIQFNKVEFVNTDENGKEFTVRIPKAYWNSDYELSYSADDALDETMTVPITFKAYPDTNNELLEIVDEQAV